MIVTWSKIDMLCGEIFASYLSEERKNNGTQQGFTSAPELSTCCGKLSFRRVAPAAALRRRLSLPLKLCSPVGQTLQFKASRKWNRCRAAAVDGQWNGRRQPGHRNDQQYGPVHRAYHVAHARPSMSPSRTARTEPSRCPQQFNFSIPIISRRAPSRQRTIRWSPRIRSSRRTELPSAFASAPTPTYGLRTWAQPAPDGGGTVTVLVAGMRASSTYHMQALVHLVDGTEVDDSDHQFYNRSAYRPPCFPLLPLNKPRATTLAPGVEVLCLDPQNGGDQLTAVVTDLSGKRSLVLQLRGRRVAVPDEAFAQRPHA